MRVWLKPSKKKLTGYRPKGPKGKRGFLDVMGTRHKTRAGAARANYNW